MPTRATVTASVRDIGSLEVPVANVTFHDVLGDARTVDLDPTLAMDLIVKLSEFVRQTGVPGRS